MNYSSEPVLTTSIYRPKTGSEKGFVKLWSSRVGNLAYDMGADTVGIFHNEETDEYLASIHWSSESAAKKFLHSPEFREALQELAIFCPISSSGEHFELLHEKAA